MHKSGFVNIIGNPNVGKSSLINLLIGKKMSIISPKSQTTRQRIKCILHGENYQIIFSDTPGILLPKYPLQKFMLSTIIASLSDADILLYLVAINDNSTINEFLINKINTLNIPIILIINKIDLIKSQELVTLEVEKWKKKLPNTLPILISCLKNYNIDAVLDKIIDLLPVHPPYFSKNEGELSDSPLRFFLAEIVREKIFLHYKQEIPYATNVVITNYKNTKNVIKVTGEIYVERDSQKGIIIGNKGYSLKKIGTLARKDMENFLQNKVYLTLRVKVEKNWRNKTEKLKRFGDRKSVV